MQFFFIVHPRAENIKKKENKEHINLNHVRLPSVSSPKNGDHGLGGVCIISDVWYSYFRRGICDDVILAM